MIARTNIMSREFELLAEIVGKLMARVEELETWQEEHKQEHGKEEPCQPVET